MNEQAYYRVSIKGIVKDDNGRILLAKEDNGMWEMLGGGLNHGEDPITCLKREIREETGMEVIYVSPEPKYFLTAQRLSNNTYIANVIYEVKLKNLEFVPSAECQELRFFSIEEMHGVQLFSNVVKLLELIETR